MRNLRTIILTVWGPEVLMVMQDSDHQEYRIFNPPETVEGNPKTL